MKWRQNGVWQVVEERMFVRARIAPHFGMTPLGFQKHEAHQTFPLKNITKASRLVNGRVSTELCSLNQGKDDRLFKSNKNVSYVIKLYVSAHGVSE